MSRRHHAQVAGASGPVPAAPLPVPAMPADQFVRLECLRFVMECGSDMDRRNPCGLADRLVGYVLTGALPEA